MAKSLSNSSKSAAKSVSKLTGKDNSSVQRSPQSSSVAIPSGSSGLAVGADNRVSVTVPGMFQLSEQTIPTLMPQFDPNAYSVADPLKPPSTMPQSSEADFEQGKTIYEGGIRALQLTGLAMDLSREKFKVVGKQSQALTAGFNALGQQETARGAYLDWKTSLESTQQKGINYQVASYTTQQEVAALPFVKTQLDEALRQQQTRAELAQAKTAAAIGSLTEFKLSLGQYVEPKKSA